MGTENLSPDVCPQLLAGATLCPDVECLFDHRPERVAATLVCRKRDAAAEYVAETAKDWRTRDPRALIGACERYLHAWNIDTVVTPTARGTRLVDAIDEHGNWKPGL